MTKITIFQNKDQKYLGFSCKGHAKYADSGSDVVCAGISILVENTVNGIKELTEEEFTGYADEKKGEIELRLQNPAGHDAQLLIKAMILGLEGIQSCYGRKFLKLQFKEV